MNLIRRIAKMDGNGQERITIEWYATSFEGMPLKRVHINHEDMEVGESGDTFVGMTEECRVLETFGWRRV